MVRDLGFVQRVQFQRHARAQPYRTREHRSRLQRRAACPSRRSTTEGFGIMEMNIKTTTVYWCCEGDNGK